MKQNAEFPKLNRIAEVLEKQGRSQRWLAKAIGISPIAMNNLCTQRSQPSLQRLREISRVLGVTMCELLQEDKPMEL